MAFSKISGVKMECITACIPEKEVYNSVEGVELFGDELSGLLRAIGVEKRHVCEAADSLKSPKRVTSLDLSVSAAQRLIQEYEIDPRSFGGIVFVTITPDSLMPNNASFAQTKLRFPETIAAFDINHACSGYIYGLWVSALLTKNLQKRILLLDGDTNSYYVSTKDKATSLLFGDAGTATILSPTGENEEWFFDFETDGSKREVLTIPSLGFRTPLTEESLQLKLYPDGSLRRDIDLKMDGQEVFNYVVSKVPKIIQNFLRSIDIDPEEIEEFDYLVLHQANAFMLRQLARKLKMPLEKVPLSIQKYGNTSSASIPLNLCSELQEPLRTKNNKILMAGFGAGLSTGVAAIQINKIQCAGVFKMV